MNLKHLEFFTVLAKTEHMAKAAEELNISQPSLSYAINSLERELGVPLFEKDGRNIKLTTYGSKYLKYVKRSLQELKRGSEYMKELLDINKGHINLGFTFTMGQELVPKVVNKFLNIPNQSGISFSFKQDTTQNLINDLLNEKVDLVFASNPYNIPNIQQEKINISHLVNQEIMAAVPLNHPLASKNSTTLEELIKYPLIAYSKQSGLRPTIDKILKDENLKPNIKLEAIEDHTIIGFVHWGFGIAIIPHLPQLATTQVHLLHINTKKNWHELYVITRNNHFMTPSTSLFLDFTRTYCKREFLDKKILI